MIKSKLLSAVQSLKKLRPMQYFLFGALFVILVEATLLLAPVTKSEASNLGDQHYQCGPSLHIVLSPSYEPGSCATTGTDSSLTSYSSSMTIKADTSYKNAGAYTVVWGVASYWCSNSSTSPCLDHFNNNGGVHYSGLTGDNKAFATLTGSNSSQGQFSGQACGVYQNDFGFYIYDNSDPKKTILCGLSWLNSSNVNTLGNTNNDASWCNTGHSCAVPTPTPTNMPTATPTPTSAPSATPTPTGVPTATPTNVPSATPTPTGMPTVTPTCTPTPTETLTPTVTPTGTLTPTATPTVTSTPTPTATGTITPTDTPTNTPTGTVTPVLGISTAPQQPLTETPKTGPEAMVWILELVGALPLGMFLRKSAKLK